MMKLASILRRKTVAELIEVNSHFDSQCFNAVFNKSGFSTVRQNIDKIYASYQVYKGKAALSVEPVLPKFTRVNSGSLKVDRPGVMMLAFSPAIGERKYDWEKKQLFALSPTEVGSLISLGPNDSCEFFHDPSMKTSNAGQVRKSLKIKPTAGGSGYFFSLSVVNNVAQTNECFTIPVTLGEFAVMRTAFSYALPHIMGWSGYISQQPVRSGDSTWKEDERPLGTVTAPKVYTNNFSELEWEK